MTDKYRFQVKYEPHYHNSWALVIGIEKYRHVSSLEIARADAESIRDVLVQRFQFPPRNVSVLLDSQATRNRIMAKFLSYESLDPDDRLFVFFAGHGATVSGVRGPIGYLLPVDGKLNKKSTLIRWDELTHNADIIPAKHIFFVMDACYSGLAIQRATPPGEKRFLTDMLRRRSRQVIAAGKADQTVADGGGPTGRNSIFTGHFLDGLQGRAADEHGIITASNLMAYAYRKVGSDPRSNQTPHFGHIDGDGDFILSIPEDVQIAAPPATDFLIIAEPEHPEILTNVDWNSAASEFAKRNGYSDPEEENFGVNEWSKRLGEWRGDKDISAFGWLALVIEPVSNEALISYDLSTLAKSLKGKVFGDKDTNQAFRLPREAMTTARSLIFYDRQYGSTDGRDDHCWERYVRIERSGAIEYCEYDRVARIVTLKENSEIFRVFLYVQLVGAIWTFLLAAKEILNSAGYMAGIKYLVNLVGTEDSILADFAHGEGTLQGNSNQKWLQPFEPGFWEIGDSLSKWRCSDPNLQFPFKIVLGSLNTSDLQRIICECGDQLSLAYNHQSQPRCFPPGSDEFPWREYEGFQ